MKKVIALVLACMLLCGIALADTPSKTTTNVTVVTPVIPAVVEAPAEETVAAVEDTEAQTTVLMAMMKHVSEGGTFASFFPEELKIDEAMELVEFISVAVENYDKAADGVKVKMTCATAFAKEDEITVLLGLFDAAGNVTWEAVEAEIEGDAVVLTLTQEQVDAIEAAAATTIAILRK